MGKLTKWIATLCLLALPNCGGGSSAVPTSATPTATAPAAPTTSTTTTTVPPAPAPTPTPSTPTSVQVECSSVVRGEKVTCKATAVTPSLTASGDRFLPLLNTDVTKSATWTSANPAIATVNNGDIEGIGVGSTTISATYLGVTGKQDVEVKRNQSDITSAAAGRYITNGHLESSTCPNVNALQSYVGAIDIEKTDLPTRNATVAEQNGSPRVFRGTFTGNTTTGEALFNSELLAFPFGSSNPVTSSKLTGTFNPNGGTTTVREEWTCNTGSGATGTIIFRIDSVKFF